MKNSIKHSVYLFVILFSLLGFCQEKPIKGYRIDGDDIVFVFDKRDYEEMSSDKHQFQDDFEDFKIRDVIVSGEFNNWTRDHWNMNRINENQFELRKNISDFTDAFSWEFKFLINGEYWAEPNSNIANIAPAKNPEGHPLYVYNLKFYTAYPDSNGNACFKLNGFIEAKKVVLAGSFNKWNENLFAMNQTENGWELTLQMNPGAYEYRFIVDGKWMADPDNDNKVENEFGEYNSVIDISKSVTFSLMGHLNAKKVILAGSFNNWSEDELKMNKTHTGWSYTLMLPGGKHHYKFIVDGQWITDPDNPVQEYDHDGNINSVYMVR